MDMHILLKETNYGTIFLSLQLQKISYEGITSEEKK